MNELGFLRLKQIVPAIVPVSEKTWWRWVQKGIAPKPVNLSGGVALWSVEDIRAFCQKRAA